MILESFDFRRPGPVVTAVDLFCGAGGTSTGLARACEERGVNLKLVAVNHDPIAIATHSTNHKYAVHYCTGLDSLEPKTVRAAAFDSESDDFWLDMLVASPECFVAGTLILTEDGLVPIEGVAVGQRVLTHEGRWKPVTSVMCSMKPTVIVKGHGHPGIETTAEHPFYSRIRYRKWNQRRRRWETPLAPPEWLSAQDLVNSKRGTFWGTPTAVPELQIPMDGLDSPTPCFWWLVGRWLGDGSVDNREVKGGGVAIACGDHEADGLLPRLEAGLPGNRWTRRRTRTAVLFETRNAPLVRWLVSHFGKLAHGKTVPAWALGMQREWREALLDGYLSADGHAGSRRQEATTVSKRLAIGTRLLAEGLGHRVALHCYPQHATEIEGRTLSTRDVWRPIWVERRKRAYAHEIDSVSWSRVKKIVRGSEAAKVFNLSVEEDESYVADGLIVHNCTHHSNARGGKPVNDQSRASGLHVARWVEVFRPKEVLLENVPEWEGWGPTKRMKKKVKGEWVWGDYPDPDRKGETFQALLNMIRAFGYAVEHKKLVAADYGDPTTRKRLFVRCSRLRKRPTWPAQTHAKAVAGQAVLFAGLESWKTAKSHVIDWSLQGQSIFERKKPLAASTMNRIVAGLKKFGGKQFILPPLRFYDPTRPQRTADVDEPLHTITAVGGRIIGLAEPFVMSAGGPEVGARPVSEPMNTVLTRDHMALVDPFMVPFYGERKGQEPRTHSVDEPVPTIPASGDGKFGVVEPYIVQLNGSERSHVASSAKSTDEPLGAVVGSGNHFGVVEPFVLSQASGGIAREVSQPIPTIATKGAVSLVDPFVIPLNHGKHDTRTHDLENPMPAITTVDAWALIEPFLVQFYGSGSGKVGHSVDKPLGAVTTKERFGLVRPVVTVNGQQYTLDIRFRMLTPKELARAMSFGDDYRFTGNRESQVKQIGNAVPCELAKALCLAALSTILGKRKTRLDDLEAVS